MIHDIASSLESFKNLRFRPGLNVLLAQKEAGATRKQTRNGAGKSSMVEIVHFLFGGKVDKDSILRGEELAKEFFTIKFDLNGQSAFVGRSGDEHSRVCLTGEAFGHDGNREVTNTEWTRILGERFFRLDELAEKNGLVPGFRSLFSYFARRQASGAFVTPEKQAEKQQTGDQQVALMYLLGLDWRIASDWQLVRDKEKTYKAIKSSAAKGVFGSIIGRTSELRTRVAIEEAKLSVLRSQLSSFQVLPQYEELEKEANHLTQQLNELSNNNVVDYGIVQELEAAMRVEAPPPVEQLQQIYEEAGVVLPGVAIRRYEDVERFHLSVVSNRREYLSQELNTVRLRIRGREISKQKLSERRVVILTLLKSHGALEQFYKLQTEATWMEAEVELLKRRFQAAEELESAKVQMDLQRTNLNIRLQRDFNEQSNRLNEAILAFEEISRQLYESAGSMNMEITPNGPSFTFPMQGSRSKGIRNMQIFCFDMMLMRICAARGIGPGFLIHDSHLFDGVDGRQVISALSVGAKMAEQYEFQYIVTMNEDDAFKESMEGFDVKDHILPVVLTDAREDGGLFGVRI